ncbi:sulfurtransferase TusA family protein [Marinomonas pollencensis]|uniref:tRNA 2-thiouridine synthesizing protein A n=1 Tax=Marinomonas pollencensis TaxID=491954 RepID=A0A3E0DRS3_9GAMM|nr:sulfurtransferase TusA family protein [Marinomonas pollencensis]REG85830.1 tRNA 2-thiouridine synthesizing protein A [Marinomonas pollencensis]
MVVKSCYEYDVILDAREDRCPMPLLKTKMALSKMQAGESLCVMTQDAGSLKDIPHYFNLVGHRLIDQQENGGVFTFIVQKK